MFFEVESIQSPHDCLLVAATACPGDQGGERRSNIKYNHQHQSNTIIQYQLKQDKKLKTTQACGKWFSVPMILRIVDKEGRAHGCP